MDESALAQVRAFNRTVTHRIGALHDEYLGRKRPLGASRVLWELDEEGTEVRTLRTRLDLDSGYLSRLLRSLEREGVVVVQADPQDQRVRIVRLTETGRTERDLLDHRSDELARSLLQPLSAKQRQQLIRSMGTVERLLTAGLVQVAVEDPSTADARSCLSQYAQELDDRFPTGFDAARSISADAEELTEPAGLLLVARLHGDPVGCGALKLRGTEPAQIKRMWVAPAARGLGIGRRILAELERQARRHHVTVLRLETNENLSEAISLYRSDGYREVEAFNEEPYAHHWFEKRLDLEDPELDS